MRLAAALAIALTGCATDKAPRAAIDHFLYYVSDLSGGADAFAVQSGLSPVYGGAHATGGTANYLVSLGDDQYLEILGPAATPEKASAAGELLTFAVRVDDIEAAVARIRAAGVNVSDPQAGGRTTPAGARLSWKTAGVDAPQFCDFVPFLIEWGAGVSHPAATSPKGAGVSAFAVAHPDADGLNDVYEAIGLALRAETAAAPSMRLALTTPNGAVELTRASAPCAFAE